MRHLRTTIVPLLLMLVTPILIIVLWMTVTRYDGSFIQFFTTIDWDTLTREWPRPSLTALFDGAHHDLLNLRRLRLRPRREAQAVGTTAGAAFD